MRLSFCLILLGIISSCNSSSHKAVEIDQSQGSSAPIEAILGTQAPRDSEIKDVHEYSFTLQASLNLFDQGSVAELKLVVVSCNPAVNVIAHQIVGTDQPQDHIIAFDASMFGRQTHCHSIVLVDSQSRYFETIINESVILPENVPVFEPAEARPQTLLQLSPISVSSSGVIAQSLARELQQRESEKIRLERESVAAQKDYQAIEDQIAAARLSQSESQGLEKARIDDQIRLLEAEKGVVAEKRARLSNEQQAQYSDESRQRNSRIAEQLKQERALQETALNAKEELLVNQQNQNQNDLDAIGGTFDRLVIEDISITTCPMGQKLDLKDLSCQF
ncbi:hypothetical protein [Pseudobacteriovorax antillogorgiicola]|nr:hypothetical protein [Pseudobacteriovorax antillogorgiicola]